MCTLLIPKQPDHRLKEDEKRSEGGLAPPSAPCRRTTLLLSHLRSILAGHEKVV